MAAWGWWAIGWEALSGVIGAIAGCIITWAAWAWRHRKLIAVVVDWLIEAAKDGRITWEEFARLCDRMGAVAREYARRRGVEVGG